MDGGEELLAVGLKEIEAAAEAIEGAAWPTPLVPVSRNDEGLLVKLEALQRTGSFKLRGAWNRMQATSGAEREAGFVTVSAGNHGQAVAWAAQRLGAPCTVWVPEGAVQAKIDKMEALGATIERLPHEEIMDAMQTRSFPHAGEATYIHPFGDPLVIAGQGTVGLEIARALDRLGTVLVPVGGGGLSSGVATAIKALHPSAQVFGIQSSTSPALEASFAAGKATTTGPPDTFADGMATDRVFEYMWPLLGERLDGSLTVGDDEIASAIRHLASETHAVAEGAGAASVAAAWRYRDSLAEPIVAVVSGGNIQPELFARILAGER